MLFSNSCGPSTHYLRVLLDGFDLDLELVDLTFVRRMWNCQVVHGERPEGGVELRAKVVPNPGRMEGHHSLVHWRHHLFTGCHILVYLLLLLVALLCFLQLIILRLWRKSIKDLNLNFCLWIQAALKHFQTSLSPPFLVSVPTVGISFNAAETLLHLGSIRNCAKSTYTGSDVQNGGCRML